jgi:histone deacetylase 1/2
MLQDQTDGQRYQSSANVANRGRGGFNRGRGTNRGRGRGGRNPGGRNNNTAGNNFGGQSSSKPKCQICDKPNHTALECWYRFEEDFQPTTNNKSASYSAAYGVDTNWYADSGASDHITGDLEKLTVREKYGGRDQVHTTNGAGMNISNIGHATLHTPNRNLHLKNILHVPKAHKNLASVHRITSDKNVFLEFHPNFFLIKDQATKTTLHQGRCEGGLYPLRLKQGSTSRSKHTFGVSKPSTSRWHSRLGHPAFPIVARVIRDNKLPFIDDSSSESVCDSCQRAKSHQLPYSDSNKTTTAPLELIHSDVWGPAPVSVGRFSYYVSFIDDHTKYTWIYLLQKKSDVFAVFRDFQALVERKFDKKILSMQTDWGGEYERLNSFLNKLALLTEFLVLMLINRMEQPKENIGT